MTAMRTSKPSLDQRSLATQAMQTAAATRAEAGVGQAGPICIYAVCETLGVTVRFNNINMEGMYQRGAQPRIHLSARRPLPRRAFNCAHELGHHKFRHGTSIDELREDAKSNPWEDSKEFLADTFAGFMLMPTIGLRRAFQARGWAPATATPAQMFTIACEFGVGYNTILTHLSASMNMLPYGRAKILNALHPAGYSRDRSRITLIDGLRKPLTKTSTARLQSVGAVRQYLGDCFDGAREDPPDNRYLFGYEDANWLLWSLVDPMGHAAALKYLPQ